MSYDLHHCINDCGHLFKIPHEGAAYFLKDIACKPKALLYFSEHAEDDDMLVSLRAGLAQNGPERMFIDHNVLFLRTVLELKTKPQFALLHDLLQAKIVHEQGSQWTPEEKKLLEEQRILQRRYIDLHDLHHEDIGKIYPQHERDGKSSFAEVQAAKKKLYSEHAEFWQKHQQEEGKLKEIDASIAEVIKELSIHLPGIRNVKQKPSAYRGGGF